MSRFLLSIFPWYHEDEVEARHARTQQVLHESHDAIGRALRVSTGAQRELLREAYERIGQRLDGDDS